MHFKLVLCVTALACAPALAGCGDDDGGDGTAGNGGDGGGGMGGRGGRDAGATDGGGGTGGSDAGTDAGVDAGPIDAGMELDAGDEDAGTTGDGLAGDQPRMASAAIAAFAPAMGITGTAEFTQTGDDVTAVIRLQNCPAGLHPVHIHAGGSCATPADPGPYLDGVRGTGIPSIHCVDAEATLVHARLAEPDEMAWSIGGDDPNRDIVGRTIVVHDPGGHPQACGVIRASEPAGD